jgi:hypothetical protein
MDSKKKFKNERGREFSADRNFWVETLHLAHQFGWKPETLRMHYLAPNMHVSATDARGMQRALERLYEAALIDPRRVFPVRVDLVELHQLKEFIAGGEFEAVD